MTTLEKFKDALKDAQDGGLGRLGHAEHVANVSIALGFLIGAKLPIAAAAVALLFVEYYGDGSLPDALQKELGEDD